MTFPKTLLADDTPLVQDPNKTVRPNGTVVSSSKEEIYLHLRNGTVILTANGAWKWLPRD